ncbi:MAG: class I SAM-dependent methyltransferase [Acidobacteria bacterium]|nr:class I SAM-dependent methyltransferase [Acidobacteriota bacterium]
MLKSRLRKAANSVFTKFGYSLIDVPDRVEVYDRDGLLSIHNHDFMQDPRFKKAYERGIRAAGDYRWQWRVHIGLWAAQTAAHLDGDFVECGVNRGFLSSAIMDLLDWDNTGKIFYLLDTFSGLDPRHIAADGVTAAARNKEHLASGFYVTDVESVKQNFAEWKNVRIIEGSVPETLAEIDSSKIAFLHIDMNCAPPEVAAFDELWDRLVPGAVILLDDYAGAGHGVQKHAMDKAAAAKNITIASLPTGQGLMIKSA